MHKDYIERLPGFSREMWQDLKMIVGLGNPGSKFSKTYHNAGFLLVDQIAEKFGLRFQTRGDYQYAAWELECQGVVREVVLVKPQTFMNLSGQVFRDLMSNFKLELNQILVAHDELEKKPESFAFKFGGSHRGHNGLRSIIQHVGESFYRLRIGVGRPEDGDVGRFVLSRFKDSELFSLKNFADQFVMFSQKYISSGYG